MRWLRRISRKRMVLLMLVAWFWWEYSTDKTSTLQDFVIATASDASYFYSLRNLVGSIRVHGGTHLPVLVYDLGLSDDQKAEIETWCNVTLRWALPGFNLSRVASHLDFIDLYAWKPVAVKQALDEANFVLWLDAGSTVVSGMQPVIQELINVGHLFVQGQDLNVVQWTHKDVWTRFNANAEQFIGKPSFSGNTIGFSRDSILYNQITIPWYNCAMLLECIMPPNSSFDNHRFDQSVLSVLLYSSGLPIRPRTDFITSDPVPCKTKTDKIIWTSRRAGSNCYAHDASSSSNCDG